ncbi:beta-alanine-activating enzyme-like [Ptychodera flava]|uniref:beta-alanine-activating enzyme-like n=1 Tax=Ptychodera flava TaxID=63121 RepID=UPI003969C272
MVENKGSNNKENSTLQTVFRDAARKNSHRTAVVFDDGERVSMVTFSEMQKRAEEIAAYLDQLHLQGEVVGLYYHPSALLPTYLVGILQASAAFAAIDPQTPSNINKYFIRNVGIRMILVQEEVIQRFLDTLGSELPVRVVQFLSDHGLVIVEVQNQSADDPQLTKPASAGGHNITMQTRPASADSLAYAIHTSGTTGLPKIVRVPHQCILPNVLHFRDTFEVTSEDTVFMASPLTFDPSIVEMFMTLSQGATLVIVPAVIKQMPRVLARILKKHSVSVLQTTPTLISRFGQDLCKSHLLSANSSLRVLAFGGEVCPTPAVINQWRAPGNQTKFYNVYGITEVSSWASCYHIPEKDIIEESSESVPLGEPLLDTELELRDDDDRIICKIGEQGKLFIGGKRYCLIGDEDTVPGDTMRDTGDVVKLTHKGFVYIGRQDNQIKRHGKRINLCQIQQLAETLPMIESCSVHQDDGGRLVLFAVTPKHRNPRQTQPSSLIKSHLHEILPEQGIPDEVVVLEKLPMTRHGKVDAKKLNEIIQNLHKGEEVPQFDRQHLQSLWQGALGLESVVEENAKFLQDGGNSITATYLADAIESWVKKTIPELLDVILHKSFHDVCVLVETTLLNSVNTNMNKQAQQKRRCGREEDERKMKLAEKSDKGWQGKGYARSKKLKMNKKPDASCDDRMQDEQMECDTGYRKGGGLSGSKPGCHDTNMMETESAIDESSEVEFSSPDWVSVSRGSHCIASHGDVTLSPWTLGDVALNPGDGRQVYLHQMWQCDTGKCVDASPLLVSNRSGSTIYIGSHSHKFMAISTATGEALWVAELGDRVESSACVSKCGSFVVVGCYDGSAYVLGCHDGTVHWKYQTDGAVKSSPVVDTQTSWIMVGSHDHHIHCIDVKRRRRVWCLYGGGGSVFSSPVLSSYPRILYAATLTGRILAIDPDTGDEKWHFSCPKPVFSSPAVTSMGTLHGCVDGNIYHVDHHGIQLWTIATQGPVFSSVCCMPAARSCDISAANDYAVFGSHDHSVYCLSIKSGRVRWQFKMPSEVYATPFIFRSQQMSQHLQIDASQEVNSLKFEGSLTESQGFDMFVLICSTSGSVVILHLLSGQLITQHSLPGEVFSSPVAHGNCIIIGCRDDKVYGFSAMVGE